MTLDLEDKTFEYTVNEDGSVLYVAGCDKKKQHLSGRDTSSKEALEADLSEYTKAYISGLESTQTSVGDDLTVGKSVSAEVKADAEVEA